MLQHPNSHSTASHCQNATSASVTQAVCRVPPYATSTSDAHSVHKHLGRRYVLSLGCAAAVLSLVPVAAAAATTQPLPAPPPIGDCPECLGEVDDVLNTCNFDAPSCVSVFNDDEAHFFAPWDTNMDPAAAADILVQVATGGTTVTQLGSGPLGVNQLDAAAYILGGTAAVMTGGDLPKQPPKDLQKKFVTFQGTLAERHTTTRGSEYVRLTLSPTGADAADVIDAEFIFLEGDRIVNVRASSRTQPTAAQGRLQLSFESGVVFDQNKARQRMEELRKALGWGITPVVADFDPRFNRKKPTLAEKVFEPFKYRYEPPANTYNSGDCTTSACLN